MPSESEIARNLRAAYHLLLRSDRRWLRSQVLSGSEARLFALLGEGRTATEIAGELGITAGAVTRLVDRLENRGLLARRRSPEDRRVVSILPTDEGREAWRVWQESADAGFRFLVHALGSKDAETYTRLLLATARHIERLSGPEGASADSASGTEAI